ncbi:Concanavalin A-like lectin/glucanase, subgroup [Artemisia annua]|uniref:Concanavalin A-like lectin/glucanase, subgroup n=1 Tax=Artemisia annua TaxID=35608 RepID=A0A2U1LCG4_ARTAN|nr:Concanavalin A-like lectin/glucanase, subgroup [Artemisia annua]
MTMAIRIVGGFRPSGDKNGWVRRVELTKNKRYFQNAFAEAEDPSFTFDRKSVTDHQASVSHFHSEQLLMRVGKEQGSGKVSKEAVKGRTFGNNSLLDPNFVVTGMPATPSTCRNDTHSSESVTEVYFLISLFSHIHSFLSSELLISQQPVYGTKQSLMKEDKLKQKDKQRKMLNLSLASASVVAVKLLTKSFYSRISSGVSWTCGTGLFDQLVYVLAACICTNYFPLSNFRLMDKMQIQGEIPSDMFHPQLEKLVLSNSDLNGTLDIGNVYSSDLIIDLSYNSIANFAQESGYKMSLNLVNNPVCEGTRAPGRYCAAGNPKIPNSVPEISETDGRTLTQKATMTERSYIRLLEFDITDSRNTIYSFFFDAFYHVVSHRDLDHAKVAHLRSFIHRPLTSMCSSSRIATTWR